MKTRALRIITAISIALGTGVLTAASAQAAQFNYTNNFPRIETGTIANAIANIDQGLIVTEDFLPQNLPDSQMLYQYCDNITNVSPYPVAFSLSDLQVHGDFHPNLSVQEGGRHLVQTEFYFAINALETRRFCYAIEDVTFNVDNQTWFANNASRPSSATATVSPAATPSSALKRSTFTVEYHAPDGLNLVGTPTLEYPVNGPTQTSILWATLRNDSSKGIRFTPNSAVMRQASFVEEAAISQDLVVNHGVYIPSGEQRTLAIGKFTSSAFWGLENAKLTLTLENDIKGVTYLANIPAGLELSGQPSFSGDSVTIELRNHSGVALRVRTTQLNDTTNGSTLNATSITSEYQTIQPNATNAFRVGNIGLTSGSLKEQIHHLQFTIEAQRPSTFNWAGVRTTLISMGLDPMVAGDLDVDPDVINQYLLSLPTCNHTNVRKVVRVNDSSISGQSAFYSPAITTFLDPLECKSVPVARVTRSAFGLTDAELNVHLLPELYIETRELDVRLNHAGLNRVGDLTVETSATSISFEQIRVPVCTRSHTKQEVIAGVTNISGSDQNFSAENTDVQTIPGDCPAGGHSILLGTFLTNEHKLIDGLQTRVITSSTLEPTSTQTLSTFDTSLLRNQLKDAGFSFVPGSINLYSGDAPNQYGMSIRACNQTGVTRYLRFGTVMIGDHYGSPDHTLVNQIVAGACQDAMLASNVSSIEFDGRNLLIDAQVLPDVLFYTDVLDQKLKNAGLSRVAPLTVTNDPEDDSRSVVEVPVCSKTHKDRSVSVGGTRLVVDDKVWVSSDTSVQTIPGSCPIGGQSLLLGSFDTSTNSLFMNRDGIAITTSQLALATPTRFSITGVTLPAKSFVEIATSANVFVSAIQDQDGVGYTRIFADVKVPLSDKAKIFRLTNLKLNGTIIVGAPSASGTCTTVTVAKAKYCQRRVELGVVPGNWVFNKTSAAITGNLAAAAFRGQLKKK